MRNLPIIVAALAPIILMAACASTAPGVHQSVEPALGRYQFDYAAPERRDISLIQAFDDGAHTYLQFNKLTMPIVVTANDNPAPLLFTRQGLYLSIPGVYALLKIETQGHTAFVENKGHPAGLTAIQVPKPAEVEPQARVPTPAKTQPFVSLVAPRAQLAIPTTEAPVPAHAEELIQSTFLVPFSGNRLTFTPRARSLLGKVAPVAISAQAITLYGRALKGETENLAVAQQLALRRAWIVKANLIRRGAAPDKFRVFYSGTKGIDAVAIDINTAGNKV